MKKMLCALLAVLLLTGCGDAEYWIDNMRHETTGEPAPTQTTQPETTPEQSGISQAWYLQVLERQKNLQEYSLFDLDGDGAQELVMKLGVGDVSTRYEFYAYSRTAYSLGEVWLGNSALVSDGEVLYVQGSKNDDVFVYRITLEGTKIQKETVYDGSVTYNPPPQYPIAVEAYIYAPEKLPQGTRPGATTPAVTTPAATTPAATTPAATTPVTTTPAATPGRAKVTAQGEPFGNIRSWHEYHASSWTTEVLIETDTAITSVKVLKLGENMDGGTVVEGTLYTLSTLTPEKPLVVGVSFADVMPLYGIRYTDTDGTIRYYAIEESLMDGSVRLRSFSPAKADTVSYGSCCNCGKALTQEEANRQTLLRENWCDSCRACPQCGELIYQNSLDTFGGEWLCYYCAFSKYACPECGGLPGSCRCERCVVCGLGMGDCECEPCAICGNRLENCICEKCSICGEVPGLCWCCHCDRCGKAIEWSDWDDDGLCADCAGG